MSVLPSFAFIVIGIGGFQPVARSFEMSACSSLTSSLPLPSRSATTGGTSGCDQVSRRWRPEGDSCTVWSPTSGVSDA